MLKWVFIVAAVALGGGNAGQTERASSSGTGDITAGYVAEEQIATGKFTSALEVRPILTQTQGNWVGVREYNGQDLVYFTHLLSWRCGLVGFHYAINGGALQKWDMPVCDNESSWPNAMTGDNINIYATYALKSVETIDITVIYDDLTTDNMHFVRKSVLIP